MPARRPIAGIGMEQWLTTERAAYGVIAALALGVRLHGLGSTLLGPAEASQALAALGGAGGSSVDLSGLSPLLHTSQRLIFALAGPTEMAARLLPALLGGLAVLFFWPLRRWTTRGGALAAALLWAISPLAVFAARSGVGNGLVAPLALAFIGLAVSSWTAEDDGARSRAHVGLGVAAGMLLLSGSGAFTALAGVVIAALILRPAPVLAAGLRSLPRRTWVAVALTWFLIGSFFLSAPAGLAGSVGLLTGWLRGLLSSTADVSAWQLGRQLLLSEPLLLGCAIAGVVAAIRYRYRPGYAVAAGTAVWIVIPLLASGRAPWDMGLATLGLSLLAGPAVTSVLRRLWSVRGVTDTWLLVGISMALSLAAAISLAGASSANHSDGWRTMYSSVGLISAVLAVAIWVLYGFLGNWDLVRRTAAAVPLALGLAWGVGQLVSLNYDSDPWRQTELVNTRVTPDVVLLQEQVRLSGALLVGGKDEAAVDLVLPSLATNPLAPVLRWALREQSTLRVSESLNATPSPIVITELADQPALSGRYAGSEYLVLDQTSAGKGGSWRSVLRWILFRETRVIPNGARVILWVDRSGQ